MNQQVNTLAALGGAMIIMGMFCYIMVSYVLGVLLGIFGIIFLLAGVMTLGDKSG